MIPDKFTGFRRETMTSTKQLHAAHHFKKKEKKKFPLLLRVVFLFEINNNTHMQPGAHKHESFLQHMPQIRWKRNMYI